MTPWSVWRRTLASRLSDGRRGRGTSGNIDGDSAAAMRYTEARMTEVARLMMEGIDEDAVDFRENL